MIKELFAAGRPLLSFEIFPPKRDADIADLPDLLAQLQALEPNFVSVTCGAGGSADDGIYARTADIADTLQQNYALTALAHLTCVMATKDNIQAALQDLKARGVHNVLALRGDIPPGAERLASAGYTYAYQLIEEIRAAGSFCIGAACYPEGHIDCTDLEADIQHMVRKQEAGADFFVSQLCFDNTAFLRFWDRARRGGITRPISAGVMPILWRGQAERMIFLCGASLPSPVVKLLHRYEHCPDDLRRAGIELCVRQMEDLLRQGVDGVHIYSMNKPDTAVSCARRFRELT
jgi:methylenetetrahydrofolate reductase (NADPH)